ncbi:MAG: RES family NAD+ phosphorylase [Bacteroidales bacterium]|nr:RES family NAD+ phosphorylase [Bacteroidales bacterium]
MIVYRLAKSKYSKDLSGKGAEISGGRWNSKGTQIIYTSESRALCVAEIAVHMNISIVPNDYNIISIEIPNDIEKKELLINKLPDGWNSFPYSNSTQLIGDSFIDSDKYLVLKVPSAVVQGDYNYLINPYHKNFKKIKLLEIESFKFNSRLFNK